MSEPSDLTREALFDRSLPDSWAPLVAAVSELGGLAAEQASGDDGKAERRERAAALRSVIVAAAGDKVQDSPDVLAWGSPERGAGSPRRCCCGRTSPMPAGGCASTCWARASWAAFRSICRPIRRRRRQVRAGLKAGLGWGEEELAAIERALEHRLSGLALKRAITAEIARRLEEGGDEAAVALMRAVYGDLPLRAGDVASVVTTTGIFFCLPLVDHGLTSRATPGDRQESGPRSPTSPHVWARRPPASRTSAFPRSACSIRRRSTATSIASWPPPWRRTIRRWPGCQRRSWPIPSPPWCWSSRREKRPSTSSTTRGGTAGRNRCASSSGCSATSRTCRRRCAARRCALASPKPAAGRRRRGRARAGGRRRPAPPHRDRAQPRHRRGAGRSDGAQVRPPARAPAVVVAPARRDPQARPVLDRRQPRRAPVERAVPPPGRLGRRAPRAVR